ncbi:MAG: threonylcarbamoyl-AMP synthase [Chitinophagaceae bacterium]|nr:threonylcarbamoyl-AMP synthase [Chitinophagaceae bacterium]
MIDFLQDVEQALEVLRKGGIILYPTDTIWGLGCDATDPEAVARIYALKQRALTKSMIILVADEKDVLQHVPGLDLQVFDHLASTDRPTTVVYDSAVGLADNVINEDGSIAIRIVKDEFCRHLVRRLRKPIVSTSANISNQGSTGLFRDISGSIKDGVDYIVKYRQQDEVLSAPSSIIRWNKGVVEIIRS